MKSIIVLLLIVLSSVAISDGKKFTVTFTVTYNTISLEDAAKKESVFRELYKDACTVDVSVKESSSAFIRGNNLNDWILRIDTLNALNTWKPVE